MVLMQVVERRELARRVILDHPDWSDRRLRQATGLSTEMFSRQRRLLIERGELADGLPSEGADGKRYRSRRVGRSRGLNARIRLIRRLIDGIGDEAWHAADSGARRLFWSKAEELCERAGSIIDRGTGRPLVS
jgi:hypothetical protein